METRGIEKLQGAWVREHLKQGINSNWNKGCYYYQSEPKSVTRKMFLVVSYWSVHC